jgi:hypothetical protein
MALLGGLANTVLRILVFLGFALVLLGIGVIGYQVNYWLGTGRWLALSLAGFLSLWGLRLPPVSWQWQPVMNFLAGAPPSAVFCLSGILLSVVARNCAELLARWQGRKSKAP